MGVGYVENGRQCEDWSRFPVTGRSGLCADELSETTMRHVTVHVLQTLKPVPNVSLEPTKLQDLMDNGR